MNLASELVSKNFVYLESDASVKRVFEELSENGVSGIIVVKSSNDKEVVGTISFKDLLIKNSNIYIPTIFEILKHMSVYEGDKGAFLARFKNVLDFKAKDVMNPNPITMPSNVPAQEAIKLFAENPGLNLILVSNPVESKLEGVIDRQAVFNFYYQYKWDVSFSPSVGVWKSSGEKMREQKTDAAMKEFGRFSIVTKFRTRNWMFLSAIFVIVGVLITLFFILKVVLK